MRVEQFLLESATRFGKKAAVVDAGRSHSYSDLARSADRVAASLVAHGVKRGDRVAIFMDDTFEAIVSAFAVLKSGAVASPVDPSTDAETLGLILSRTGAAALVTESRLGLVAASAMIHSRSVRLVLLCGGDRSTANDSCLVFEEIVGGLGNGPLVDRAGPASDPALVVHSVSADGLTEAATFTHADVIAGAAESERPAPTLASILTQYGLSQMLAAIRAGATLVLETRSALRHPAAGDAAGLVPAIAS